MTPFPQNDELLPVFHHHESRETLLNTHSHDQDINSESTQALLDGIHLKKNNNKPLIKRTQFEKWKFTIFLAFIASVVVLLFNTGFLLYTAAHHEQQDQKGVLYEGDYEKVHRLNVGLHFLVNLLSTALLSASNFGMQCLVAPTRQDIDQAHRRGKWLDIGVPSMRNLFQVSKRRLVSWVCLAVSSLPFHLVYNSTIFLTQSVAAYNVFAGEAFETTRDFKNLRLTNSSYNAPLHAFYQVAQNGSLHNLSRVDCINALGQTFQSGYTAFLLVTDSIKGKNGSNDSTYDLISNQRVFHPGVNEPYTWLCEGYVSERDCSKYLPDLRSQGGRNNWTVTVNTTTTSTNGTSHAPTISKSYYKVDYCLAQNEPQHSKLQYSLPLVFIIIGFNTVKCVVLLYIWLGLPHDDPPLLTIGDAVASFLRRPDIYSRRCCLITRSEAARLIGPFAQQIENGTFMYQKTIEKDRMRRYNAVSTLSLHSTAVMWFTTLSVGSIAFVWLTGWVSKLGYAPIWTAPLHTINTGTLLTGKFGNWPESLIPNVLITNSPQLINSILYFATNSVLTSICSAEEWSSYQSSSPGKGKGLRVSNNPIYSQRSTYFLTIPYRYAAPLLTTSAVLHWLISESLFTVGIEVFSADMERVAGEDFIACGFSAVATVSSIVIGLVMCLVVLFLGDRRVKGGMPVVGSCSFAIAAACQVGFDPNRDEDGDGDGSGRGRSASAVSESRSQSQLRRDEDMTGLDGLANEGRGQAEDNKEDRPGLDYLGYDMSILPVRWGAVSTSGPIGHCTFTSEDIEELEEGRIYQ